MPIAEWNADGQIYVGCEGLERLMELPRLKFVFLEVCSLESVDCRQFIASRRPDIETRGSIRFRREANGELMLTMHG